MNESVNGLQSEMHLEVGFLVFIGHYLRTPHQERHTIEKTNIHAEQERTMRIKGT